MTLETALLAVERLHVLFLMFGLILFASNAGSTRQAENIRATKRKKKTTVAGKSKRREAGNIRMVKARRKPNRAKAAKPEPLSIEDQRRVDAYRIGRDWPGFKNVSQVPL